MSRWALMAGGSVVAAVAALPVGMVLLLGGTASGACGGTVAPADPSKWTAAEISALWVAHGGDAGTTNVAGVGAVANPTIAGAVGMAESGGDPGIVNSIGAGGLMQIHPPEPDYLDPDVNMTIAVRKWKASGWQPWEAFTGPDGRGDDGPWRSQLAVGAPGDATTTGGSCAAGPIAGTPKHIIDTVVLPLARANGIPRTVAENDAANAAHGPTKGGGESDHQGPPDVAWAADMSNGVTTPQEDALAQTLADRFDIPWAGAGLVSATHDGYRFQLIYRINTPQAGDHFNHVHFGVRVTP